MTLIINVLQGTKEPINFEVKLLDNTKIDDMADIFRMEQFLNLKTDHRWHLNVKEEE